MNRKITDLTLALVEAMANDPESPQGLRDFHRHQLEALRREVARQRRPARSSPFSRFADYLEHSKTP